MRTVRLWILPAALLACGGSSFNGATIQINGTGLSPSTVSVPIGGQVKFVNQDNADHQVASPSCSELTSGTLHHLDSFTATFATGPKSCTFNDALNPSSTPFQGMVNVVSGGGGGGGGGGGPGY